MVQIDYQDEDCALTWTWYTGNDWNIVLGVAGIKQRVEASSPRRYLNKQGLEASSPRRYLNEQGLEASSQRRYLNEQAVEASSPKARPK